MSAEAPPVTPDVLERVMGDPAALVERIVRQVLEQLARRGDLALGGEDAPEEMLATALGNRLAGMLVDDPPADAAEAPEELAGYVQLLDRSYALAAALGACECWGEHAGCHVCRGEGYPGWVEPDARLFARYVRPAIRRARKERPHA